MTVVSKILSGAVAAALLSAAPLWAQSSYPDRPVELVVPYPPGGLTDMLTRAVAERLSKKWDRQVITVNMPGAGGVVATNNVINAKADGYTLLFGTDATLVTTPLINPDVTYDATRDLVPVSSLGAYQLFLSVNKDMPVNTLAEFVDYAKAQSKPLDYSSVGQGSAHHLAMEVFAAEAGIEMTHIPYQGGAPATLALVSKEVPAMFNGPAPIKEYLANGEIRALAASGSSRSKVLPDVPTLGELGYKDFSVVNWYGLLAPAGTPADVVSKLEADIAAVIADPEFKAWQDAQGIDYLELKSEEFKSFIDSEKVRLGGFIKKFGIEAE